MVRLRRKIRHYADVPIAALEYVASQLGPNVDANWVLTKERTDRRRRAEIRVYLELRPWSLEDANNLRLWLSEKFGDGQVTIHQVREVR